MLDEFFVDELILFNDELCCCFASVAVSLISELLEAFPECAKCDPNGNGSNENLDEQVAAIGETSSCNPIEVAFVFLRNVSVHVDANGNRNLLLLKCSVASDYNRSSSN